MGKEGRRGSRWSWKLPLQLAAAAALACAFACLYRAEADVQQPDEPAPDEPAADEGRAELAAMLAVLRGSASGLGFELTVPEPAYLGWGYDAKHPRLRERWQQVARELDKLDPGFSVVEWGSGLGGVALSIAERYTGTPVLSVEGEVEGNPQGEHMKWARLPAMPGGMTAHQRWAARTGGLRNVGVCRAVVGPQSFEAALRSEPVVDVQIALQFFHWLRQVVSSPAGFRDALGTFAQLARVTIIDLPPPGAAVPDTSMWFAEAGGDVETALRDALEKQGVEATVTAIPPLGETNPFHLFRIEVEMRPTSGEEHARRSEDRRSLESLKTALACSRGTHDGRGKPEPEMRWMPHDVNVKLSDGHVYLLRKGQLQVWEEMSAVSGRPWYYSPMSATTQWDPPTGPHWRYVNGRFQYRGAQREEPSEPPRRVSATLEYAQEPHPSTGKVYYWNEGSGESVWTRPRELGIVSAEGMLYWQDPATGKSTWTRPQEYDWEELQGAVPRYRNRQSGEITGEKPPVLLWHVMKKEDGDALGG